MSEDLKVINAPERIYLQIGDDFDPGEVDFEALQEVTWCADNIHGTDIAYVRAEYLEAAYFRIAELEAKCRLYEASLDKADVERDALAKDAERYRWLRYENQNIPMSWQIPSADALDAAIDAMKEQAEHDAK